MHIGVFWYLADFKAVSAPILQTEVVDLDVYNHYNYENVKKRFRSLVGYGVCFTRRRSPVRSWAEPFFCNLSQHGTRPAANMCSAQNVTGGELIGYPTRNDVLM